MRHRRAVVGADLDPSAVVGLEPGVLEREVFRLPLSSRGVEDDLGRDPLPARKDGQRSVLLLVDRRHLLAEPEDDPEVA